MSRAATERAAVFLDRDGVILEEHGYLTDVGKIRIAPGAPEALAQLARAGFTLVVATNQPAIARGLVDEQRVVEIHRLLTARLSEAGAEIRAFYVCPHHPNADLDAYRVECDCRKPRPGLLIRAASELGLDLRSSFMLGDRPTDVAAGARAGCRTVLVRTGAHAAPLIESPDALETYLQADYVCDDVESAVDWILEQP